MKKRVSLVMIARNEAADLPACVASVRGLADEIVLVDSGSTDGTRELARGLGARVESREFDSFAGQKGYALSLATSEWVLHLDPDETLTPELREEIVTLLEGEPSCAAYDIPYRNFFLGREMRHSGLSSESHVRLFLREKSSFGGGLVHEGIEVKGPVGKLKGRIEHRSYPDLDEYLSKFNEYTSLAARKMRAEGKRFSALKLMSVPFEFAKRYIIRLGFLDGIPGLAWAACSAMYVFVKYIKLWRLEQGENK